MSLFLFTIVFLAIILSLHIVGLLISSFFIVKFKTINIDGYNIHYRTTGNGPKKVILIHGMFSNLHCWEKLIEFKAEDTEYIALDLPQMAESQTKNLKTPDQNVEDLIYQFCKKLNLDSPYIVGCSLGGLVAFLAASKYSDYFKKCIIVSSPFNSKILLLPLYKFSFLSPFLNIFVNPLVVMPAHRQMAQKGFTIKQSLIIFSKFRFLNHFIASLKYTSLIPRAEKQLIIPTKVENFHFIWGTNDHLVKKGNFENFIGSNQHLEYEEIPEATHHPMESHPGEFTNLLTKIISASN